MTKLPESRYQMVPVGFANPKNYSRVPSLHGIYRITCLTTNMCYVGQAYDLAHRCLEHIVQLRRGIHTNPRLMGAYKRLGPGAFQFEVLEIYHGRWSPDCLSPAEQRWMDAHERDKLFNIRKAGSDQWLRDTTDKLGDAAIPVKAVKVKPGKPAVKGVNPDAHSSVPTDSPTGDSTDDLDAVPKQNRPPGRGTGRHFRRFGR